MSLKNVLLMSLFLMIGPSSYATLYAASYDIVANTKSILINSAQATAPEQKQWLFLLSADKGRILKTKSKGSYISE